MKFLTALLFLFLSISANAQTTAGTLRLQWQLPTTGCDMLVSPPPCGKPLTGDAALLGLNVYISTNAIADDSILAPTLVLPATATTINHQMTVPNGSKIYVRIKALNAWGASLFSNQVIKTISTSVRPAAPTNLSIELTITP